MVREALLDTRIVLINGARQSGKSTLAAQMGREHDASWHTLDRADTLQAALNDPTEFVRSDQRMVIDEVQRAPGLFLAMKELVDSQPVPGRFLLTGSARIMGLRGLPDTLPGRIETVELWPLSQGEIDGKPDGFIDAAFELGPELKHDSADVRRDYCDRLVRGGMPEAVGRAERRRSRFHQSYLADLVNRDVMQLSTVEKGRELRSLIRLLAARSGQILVPAALGRDLGLTQHTVNHYLSLLEEVFLIKRLPAWSRNLSTRAVGASKVAFVDSGLACSLLNQQSSSLAKFDSPLGPLLEAFVTMEVARQATWSTQPVELFHYRTRDQVEVDLVIENLDGRVIAIEVKATSSVRGDDFKGLRHLQSRLGDDLVAGYLLHLGQATLPFGPKLRALPVSALWETGI
jgi:predicted AAA+ superfamily ATPase